MSEESDIDEIVEDDFEEDLDEDISDDFDEEQVNKDDSLYTQTVIFTTKRQIPTHLFNKKIQLTYKKF